MCNKLFAKLFAILFVCSIGLATTPATMPPARYSTGSSITTFDFAFKIGTTSEIIVILKDNTAGTEATLTEGLHYTVSATNNDYSSGGTVTTLLTYPAGYTLIIDRQTALTQDTHYIEGEIFPAATTENLIDKIVRQIQDAQTQLDRSVHIPRGDSASTVTELPGAIGRANKIVGCDPCGNFTMLPDTYEPDTNTPISSYMRDVVNAPDANTARDLLKIDSNSYNYYINVKNPVYGAIGDGNTDDTNAIQRAIAACPNNGIITGNGYEYLVSALTIQKNNITMQDIYLKTKACADGNLYYIPVSVGTIGDTNLYSNIRFYNVHINGNRHNQTGIDNEWRRGGFRFYGRVKNVEMLNCSASYCANDGIGFYNDNTDMAGYISANDSLKKNFKLTDCSFTYNRRAGMAIEDMKYMTVTNCDFSYNGTNIDGGLVEGDEGKTYGTEHLNGTGVQIEALSITDCFSNITFSNSRFLNNGRQGLLIEFSFVVDANDANFTPRENFLVSDCLADCGIEANLHADANHTLWGGIGIEATSPSLQPVLWQNINITDCITNYGRLTIHCANDVAIVGGRYKATQPAVTRDIIVSYTDNLKLNGVITQGKSYFFLTDVTFAEDYSDIQQPTSILAKKQLRKDVNEIVTEANIMAFWIFEKRNGTDINDYSGLNHSLTLSADANTLKPGYNGILPIINFDAVPGAYADVADHNDFSFGNGTTDSAFSIVALVKYNCTENTDIIAKLDYKTGATQKEWWFGQGGNSYLYFKLFDNSAGAYIDVHTETMTADNGQVHCYTATYDGSKDPNNMYIYRDGTILSVTKEVSGSYTAMENKSAKTGTYHLYTDGTTKYAGKHEYMILIIIREELTADQVQQIDEALRGYAGTF